MTSSKKSKISLLMTGSELMSGDIVDSNSAFIAQALSNIGLAVDEKVTVGDHREDLQSQIIRLSKESSLLIINGGLGPTIDDLTAEVLAQAAKEDLTCNKEAEEHVINWCEKRGFTANTANLKQAILPSSSCIFVDAPGSAPAFHMMLNECLVIATPGVPSELKHITRNQLLDFIPTQLSIKPSQPWQKTFLLGIGESRLQQLISDEMTGIEEALEIGFRADFPALELKFRPVKDLKADDKHVVSWQYKLLSLLENYIISTDTNNFACRLVQALQEKGKTFSCAESCTGGLIASEITKIPGASDVFPGSIVSYSNQIKHKLLNVPQETLKHYGAVSEQTVQAMFSGIIDAMQSDYAIAVTGIAGPGGGSIEKPIGTVWIAWGTAKNNAAACINVPLGRVMFQQLLTTICLDLTYRHLNGNSSTPNYLKRWQL